MMSERADAGNAALIGLTAYRRHFARHAALLRIAWGSAAHQPDQGNAGAGGGEASDPQCRWRNGEDLSRSPLHALWEKGVETTLDPQHEGERRPQVIHCRIGLPNYR